MAAMEPSARLIQACIAGDRSAQSRLYVLFAPRMFAVCLRYARSRQEAEEMLQEGFVQVFRGLYRFRFAGSFEGWVRKIMVYCAIQYYRNGPKQHRVIPIEAVLAKEPAPEETSLERKELLLMVQALPPACRLVFNLHVFEGLKHREIAGLLGISEGTSKSNLFDAKVLLQRAVANSLKIAE